MKLTKIDKKNLVILLNLAVDYELSFIDCLAHCNGASDVRATRLAEKNISNANKLIDRIKENK